MAEKNFMTAGTEIDGYIEKHHQCMKKIANIIAEACVSRAHSGKTESIARDVSNLIKSLSIEEQNEVLLSTISALTKQIPTGGNENHQSSGRPQNRGRNDIFSSRGL